ncbi:hypothetical protein V3481_019505 [Fusarium oxysporum f. sp. vasinfectum]
MILRNQMKHTTKLLHAPTVSKQLILHNRFHPRLFPAMAASRGHRALPVIQFATDPQCRNQSNGIQIGIFMPGTYPGSLNALQMRAPQHRARKWHFAGFAQE